MNFKKRSKASTLPEVNLVPMLDVLMSVLTFFIIISMALTGQQESNLELPDTGLNQEEGTTAAPPDNNPKLIVSINKNKEILVENQQLTENQLLTQITDFVKENEQGEVIVKADKSLEYQEIYKLLQNMGTVGGDRVSLAINN